MDPAQYRTQYSYGGSTNTPVRPGYPTPPPSSMNYHEYEPQPDSYPSYSENYQYEGYTQTPTPMQSHSPSPLHNQGSHDAAAAAASYSIHSPVNQTFSFDTHYYSSPTATSPPASPYNDDESDVLSVSTAFHPTAHPHLPPVDTIFSSSEGVLFYLHSNTILNTCSTAFHSFLGSHLSNPNLREILIPLDAPSEELNVILHMLYGTSSAAHSPSFETLVNAVDRMPSYSIQPDKHILPSTPLYDLLLSHAPVHPLDVYGLAAYHGLHTLAVSSSSHLLSYSLPSITDGQAERIGAIYLKKLLLLHVDRGASLKKILLQPPHPHPPTRQCGFGEQKRLTRAWALVSAYLAWDAKPDLSTHSMQSALDPLMEHLDCEPCHQALRDRINDVIVQWASVGRTI